MFSKLLKHEWKANWSLMSILTLAVVGVGILGTIALRVLVNYGDAITQSESVLVLLLFPLTTLVSVSYMGIAVYVAAVGFVLMYRFYKHKFTDEGYLTFTLPVKTNHIFLSSGLNMVIWTVISFLVALLMYAMMLLCGTAQEGLFNDDIVEAFSSLGIFMDGIGEEFTELMGAGFVPLLILNVLVVPLFSTVIAMTCVTLGAVVAKKHKILAIIGISYGVEMVLSILLSVVTYLPLFIAAIIDPSMESPMLYITLTLILTFLLQAGITVGGYFLSTRLMKNKLNLP
jgi:hypothetical protein